MKIAVLGAGAMGSWIGGKLATVVPGIQLLTTNAEHLQAISKNGLLLKSASSEQRVKVVAMHPGEFQGPVDIVLLMTKSFQSDAALSCIAQTFTSGTSVLSLQNGLGNLETIGKYVSTDRVMLGNTMLPIDKIAPGVVEARGQGTTYFNGLNQLAGNDQCKKLHDLMTKAGLDARLDETILQRIWSKVAFNAGMNALSALSHGTPGTIRDSVGAKELAADAARETVKVATAQKITVGLEQVLQTIEFACQNHEHHKTSMLQDLLARKRTEVDSLNGEIVRQGEVLGVATPVNRVLATLVRLAELSHQRYA